MTKNITAGIIVIIFLFNIGGYLLMYHIELLYIHKQVECELREGIPENELVKIEITETVKSQIKWVEEGREFRLQDEMFDLAYSKTVNGKLFFYCLQDDKETFLLTRLDQHITDLFSTNLPLSKATKEPVKTFSSFVFLPGTVLQVLAPEYKKYAGGVPAVAFRQNFCPKSFQPPES